MTVIKALGFIETKGLIGAIEAADVMLKAADVCLLEKNTVGGGLVTITVAGEVSAVKASVDAAVVALKKINGTTLVSCHVIARPDIELKHILCVQEQIEQEKTVEPKPVEHAHPKAEAEMHPAPPVKQEITKSEVIKPNVVVHHEHAQLKKMSLHKLRQVARGLSTLTMSHEVIASADKKSLIEAIITVYNNSSK